MSVSLNLNSDFKSSVRKYIFHYFSNRPNGRTDKQSFGFDAGVNLPSKLSLGEVSVNVITGPALENQGRNLLSVFAHQRPSREEKRSLSPLSNG